MHKNPIYKHLPSLILASASPRRAELLEALGLTFKVFATEIDERAINEPSPSRLTERLAQEKARYAQKHFPHSKNKLFLAADTIVWLNGKRLDKPRNILEASATLAELSGCTHSVYSAFTLRYNDTEVSHTEETRVRFAPLSPTEVIYYIGSAEPFDKAGAYGIQEWLGLIGVERIEGAYTNVMGLPTAALHRKLLDFCI